MFLIDDTKDSDSTNKGASASVNTELTNIHTEIIKVCTELGGQKNTELMNTLKTFVASGNPRLIKSVDKAKECLETIKRLKK